ncbi:MAG: helix-turn-helix domain-containing protein [Nitrospirae bacterium]|nr:helix-turn-helix domain-containing protein [Nitrospirota bacterium]MBF0518603.1 helix-turn-helix domain-containing protein [Nitrospirota bacterium]MBF0534068.1 helix-turn-helix domain-containing protein [Nitrospirota bacterium]MBF0616227.1 helix-turn-helix domain-containing protein [Nitrospirota bacterium]
MSTSGEIESFFEIDEIRTELTKGPEFYTLDEIAKMLRLSYITMYRLVEIGDIAASKVAGRWRITKSALQHYLESRHPFNMED